MKKIKRTLCLLVAFAMLISTAYAAFPSDGSKTIESDPFVRTVVENDPYGVLFYNDFNTDTGNKVSGSATNTSYYLISDYGMSMWGTRDPGSGIGKDKWYNLLEDEVNADYRDNAVEMHDLYGGQVMQSGAYFGEDKIAGKKLNVSLQIRKDRTDDTVGLYDSNFVYVQLFNNDSGAYDDANVISGTSGHHTRKKYFIELMTDISSETANYGAGTMLNGTFSGLGNTSAKLIGLDDTDWHQIDGVVDVSNGAVNATVTLFVDGTEVYTKTGNFISENAFDADGNFTFNGMTLNVQSETNRWSWVDNVKITNTEGANYGVQNVKKVDNAVYVELTNSILAGQEIPAIALRKVGTSNLIYPDVDLEGSQAIKIDLSDVALDNNAEYEIVYPEGMILTDINGRNLDTNQIVTFYNDGTGNGVKSARLIGADGESLSIPKALALKGETGMVLQFEEALSNPQVTFTADDEEVDVETSVEDATLTITWDSMAADAYELVVYDGDTAIYTYKKIDIAVIDPIIPDDSYGLVWSNDFEYNMSDYKFENNAKHDLGGMIFTNATDGGSFPRHYTREDDNSGLRGLSLSIGDIYKNPSKAFGTKSFDTDVSGKKMMFSFQTKFDKLNAEGKQILDIYLSNDGPNLQGSNVSNGNSTKMLNMGYYASSLPSGYKGYVSMWDGSSGAAFNPTELNDTAWHQIDIVVDADAKTVEFYIDGVHKHTNTTSIPNSTVLDANGNLTFDKMVLYLYGHKIDAAGNSYTESTNAEEGQTAYQRGYLDNLIITKLDDSASIFGVKNVKVGTDAIFVEFSATVATEQNAPALKLRKVGTDELITPSEIAFEGSQAIKLTVSGLEADAEYEIVYPDGMSLTDISGRTLDKEQLVTFYVDGESAGVKEARFVNLDNTLAVPTASPVNSVKGLMIKTEAAASSVAATLTSASGSIDVVVTGEGSDYIVGWSNFLSDEEYTLTVTADGEVIYEYIFTPVVSGELSITEFAVYDELGNEIKAWDDSLRGLTLTVSATLVNPTGEDKFAAVIYATYADRYMRSVNYNNNDGEPIEATFGGTPIEVEFEVPADATEIKAMLWDGMDTMKPLTKAIKLIK